MIIHAMCQIISPLSAEQRLWTLKRKNKLCCLWGMSTILHHAGLFPSKHSIMADCPIAFSMGTTAEKCTQLQVGCIGWWECWGLGDGGCPLNLLIALWQSTWGRYHTLCRPPAQKINWVALQRWHSLRTHRKHIPDEGHHTDLWGDP